MNAIIQQRQCQGFTATSSDLNAWTGLSSVGCSGCRHGTAIAK